MTQGLTHLTPGERSQIEVLLRRGDSKRARRIQAVSECGLVCIVQRGSERVTWCCLLQPQLPILLRSAALQRATWWAHVDCNSHVIDTRL
jgi:hypothetical protein